MYSVRNTTDRDCTFSGIDVVRGLLGERSIAYVHMLLVAVLFLCFATAEISILLEESIKRLALFPLPYGSLDSVT